MPARKPSWVKGDVSRVRRPFVCVVRFVYWTCTSSDGGEVKSVGPTDRALVNILSKNNMIII